MATFRDENGKALTEEELQRRMESGSPLTDEELEQATGGTQHWQQGDKFQDICTCGGTNFQVVRDFANRDYKNDGTIINRTMIMKCLKCNHMSYRIY